MSKYSIDSTTLTSIGNAIRSKEGSSALIPVSNFATRIANLPSGGGARTFNQNVVKLGEQKLTNISFSSSASQTFPNMLEAIDQRVSSHYLLEKHGIDITGYTTYQFLYFIFPNNEPSVPPTFTFTPGTNVTSVSIIDTGSFVYNSSGNRIYYYILNSLIDNSGYTPALYSYPISFTVTINGYDSSTPPSMALGMFNILKKIDYNLSFEVIPTELSTTNAYEIFENPSVNSIFPIIPIVPLEGETFRSTDTYPYTNEPYYNIMCIYNMKYDVINFTDIIKPSSTSTAYARYNTAFYSTNLIRLNYMENLGVGLGDSYDSSDSINLFPYNVPNNVNNYGSSHRGKVLYFNFEGVSNRRTRT